MNIGGKRLCWISSEAFYISVLVLQEHQEQEDAHFHTQERECFFSARSLGKEKNFGSQKNVEAFFPC